MEEDTLEEQSSIANIKKDGEQYAIIHGKIIEIHKYFADPWASHIVMHPTPHPSFWKIALNLTINGELRDKEKFT